MLVEQLLKELVGTVESEIQVEKEYATKSSKAFISMRASEADLEQALQKLISDKSPVPTVKTENPVVRRDTLGSESIGRKYRVMSDDDSDFPIGSVVTCVKGLCEDGGTFADKASPSGKNYMRPEVLLQEITEAEEYSDQLTDAEVLAEFCHSIAASGNSTVNMENDMSGSEDAMRIQVDANLNSFMHAVKAVSVLKQENSN